jgi:hypothetical protein
MLTALMFSEEEQYTSGSAVRPRELMAAPLAMQKLRQFTALRHRRWLGRIENCAGRLSSNFYYFNIYLFSTIQCRRATLSKRRNARNDKNPEWAGYLSSFEQVTRHQPIEVEGTMEKHVVQ